MKADGYSLDDKRQPIEVNDIADIIERYNNRENEINRTRKDQSFLVSVEDIISNDYDLSINKYKEVEYEEVVYSHPTVIMERINRLEEEIQQGLVELGKMLEG